jgi:tetratricopeptide (TPR) repeat protein/TolB-like protein
MRFMIPLLCATLLVATPVGSEETQAKAVRIVVTDFEKIAGAERFDVLRRGIAESIQISLLPYDNYHVVVRDALWLQLAELNVPFAEYSPARLFREDVLKSMKVDYVVGGSFVELGGNLNITTTLRTVSGQTIVSFPSLRTTERELSSRIGTLARRIVESLSPVVGYKPRTIAVSCFINKSLSGDTESAWRARDLAGVLARQLVGPRGTTIIDWDAGDRVCTNPFAAPSAMEPVDAIVTATVRLDAGLLTVSPEFLIDDKRRSRVSVLPVVARVSEDYGRLRSQLTRRVAEYIGGGLSSAGTWKLLEPGLATFDPVTAVSHGKDLQERDPKLALLYFYRALLTRPEHGEARYFAGAIQLRQRSFDDAAEHFERALDTQSGLPEVLKAEAYRGLAQAQRGGGRFADAIRTYERALQSMPDNTELYRDLAVVYMFTGNYSQADETFRQALLRNPRDVESLHGRGVLASRSDDEEQARDFYLKALAVDPDHESSKAALADIAASRAEIAWEAGKQDVAMAETDQELSYRPSAQAYARRALYRTERALPHEQDRYLEGIKDYQRALGLLGKIPAPGLRGAIMLNITELYVMTSQYEEAQRWATRALREITDSPVSLTMARYLLVVSKILATEEHDADLERLRTDLRQHGASASWNFTPLTNFAASAPSIGEQSRQEVLTLSDEVKRAVRRGRAS